MAFRKTNIGGLITYDADKAAKELLIQFSRSKGNFADVGTHYGVATTTVRRWVLTLKGAGKDIEPRIERIRELALEVG